MSTQPVLELANELKHALADETEARPGFRTAIITRRQLCAVIALAELYAMAAPEVGIAEALNAPQLKGLETRIVEWRTQAALPSFS